MGNGIIQTKIMQCSNGVTLKNINVNSYELYFKNIFVIDLNKILNIDLK